MVVEETLQGIASVKAFANEGFEVARYRQARNPGRFIGVVHAGARYQGVFGAFITFALFEKSIVLVMWYGAILVERGSSPSGS